eukprot:g31029.t1
MQPVSRSEEAAWSWLSLQPEEKAKDQLAQVVKTILFPEIEPPTKFRRVEPASEDAPLQIDKAARCVCIVFSGVGLPFPSFFPFVNLLLTSSSGSERGTYQKVFRRALLRALTEKLKRTSARRSQGSDPAAEELQALWLDLSTHLLLPELKRLGWLTLAMDPRALALKVELEWQVYNKAQAAWRLQASDGKERHEWLEQCRQAAQEQKAAGEAAEAIRQAKRATWRFDIPEVRQVLMEKSILPSGFETASHTMVDLLTLPDENEGAAKEKLEAMIDALEALHGESLEVRMTKIFISETTACALVALPPVLADMGKVGPSSGSAEIKLKAELSI